MQSLPYKDFHANPRPLIPLTPSPRPPPQCCLRAAQQPSASTGVGGVAAARQLRAAHPCTFWGRKRSRTAARRTAASPSTGLSCAGVDAPQLRGGRARHARARAPLPLRTHRLSVPVVHRQHLPVSRACWAPSATLPANAWARRAHSSPTISPKQGVQTLLAIRQVSMHLAIHRAANPAAKELHFRNLCEANTLASARGLR